MIMAIGLKVSKIGKGKRLDWSRHNESGD